MRVALPTTGPRHHGVVRHAAQLAVLLEAQGVTVADGGGYSDVTHAQFTDGLWGPDIDTAAGAFELWSRAATGPLVVTIHDVPGADPDPERDARRSAGYARVVASSDAVIVSSRHEAAKTTRLGMPAPHVVELPLPVAARTWQAGGYRAGTGTLGVLGFVYPGKGHVEVIAAAARCDPPRRVVFLGAPSPGHEALLRELRCFARDLEVDLTVTGPLSDTDLARLIATITVPVVPARQVSASASLLTWISHRRRPLVADGPYSREVALRHPSVTQIYDAAPQLDALIELGVRRPATTRLAELPVWSDVGGEHVAIYRELLERVQAR